MCSYGVLAKAVAPVVTNKTVAAASTLNKVMMISPLAILVPDVRTGSLVHLVLVGTMDFAFARRTSSGGLL
jgi:hypothetical protein